MCKGKLIILVIGNFKINYPEKYIIHKYNNKYIFYRDVIYLIVIGDFNLSDTMIDEMVCDMNNTNANLLSPVIMYKNKIEYCGGVIDGDKYIYLDNAVCKKIYFENISDTMLPYFNLCMIKNVSEYMNSDKKNIIEKIVYASLETKNVKVDPFIVVDINNKPKQDYVFCDNYHKMLDIDLDRTVITEIINGYNKHGLMSFKMFNNNYYLNYNNKKNVLVIEYLKFTPNKDSGSKYLYNILCGFVRCGYNVYFANVLNGNVKYINKLKRLGVYVINDVKKFIANNYNIFDYVVLSRTYAFKYYYDYIKSYIRCKIYYLSHELLCMKNILREKVNVESIIDSKNELDEKKALNMCNNIIVVSKSEHEYLGEKSVYFPICYSGVIGRDNYVGENVYFVGCGQESNINSLSYFLKNKWENIGSCGIKLIVIGEELKLHFSENMFNNVVFVGHIIDEKYDEYISQFRMNVIYLLYGGGIKGRIIESSRLGIPCICNNICLDGMEYENMENVIIENFTDNYVSRFVDYYNDITLMKKIGEGATNNYLENYSEKKCDQYIRTIFQ